MNWRNVPPSDLGTKTLNLTSVGLSRMKDLDNMISVSLTLLFFISLGYKITADSDCNH